MRPRAGAHARARWRCPATAWCRRDRRRCGRPCRPARRPSTARAARARTPRPAPARPSSISATLTVNSSRWPTNSRVPSSGSTRKKRSATTGTVPAATDSSATTGTPGAIAGEIREDDFLGGFVGGRDGRRVGLVAHGEVRGVHRHDGAARALRGVDQRLQQVAHGAASYAARDHGRRTTRARPARAKISRALAVMRRVQLEYSLLVPGTFTGSSMPIMSSSCTVTSAAGLLPRYTCTRAAELGRIFRQRLAAFDRRGQSFSRRSARSSRSRSALPLGARALAHRGVGVEAELLPQIDVVAAPPAVQRRQVVRGHRGERVAHVVGGRDELAVLLFEQHHLVVIDAELRQRAPDLVGHHAQVLAHDQALVAMALERHDAEQVVEWIVHVAAVGGLEAARHPPLAEQRHHVIEAQRAAVAHAGAHQRHERRVRGAPQLPRILRRNAPLLARRRRCGSGGAPMAAPVQYSD